MEKIEYLLVEHIRIDKYLVDIYPNLSRTYLQTLIDNEDVLVNDKVIKANYLLKTNDIISIQIVPFIPKNIKPTNIFLDIIYEDEAILIVNKPSGMVVHPALGHIDDTLVNALMYYTKDLALANGDFRAGIVHRIDKDTSGLLVVTKTNEALFDLANQFQLKTTTRIYHAICEGVISENQGKITAPIGRSPKNRQMMAVVKNGKLAVTHFKVLKRLNNATYIQLALETGRTHQIRVHMKYIGYPILGDNLYGNLKNINETGQYLHAKELGFIHPTLKKYVSFDSKLPDEFENKLKELEINKL